MTINYLKKTYYPIDSNCDAWRASVVTVHRCQRHRDGTFNAILATMKKPALLLLISVALFPVLFSSCSGVGSTAGNGASSSATAQANMANHPWENDPDSGFGRQASLEQ